MKACRSLHVLLAGALLIASSAAAEKTMAKLPLERLLELHVAEDPNVDPEALREILLNRLQDVPTERLLEIEQQVKRPNLPVSDVVAPPPPLQTLLEADSVVVHGKVSQMQIVRDDVIRNILERIPRGYRFDITLEVSEVYPSDVPVSPFTCRYYSDYLKFAQAGGEYLFLFRRENEGLGGQRPRAILAIAADRTIKSMDSTLAPISLEKAWSIVREQLDALRGTAASEVASHLQEVAQKPSTSGLNKAASEAISRDAAIQTAKRLPEAEALPKLLELHRQGDQSASYFFCERVSPGSQQGIALLKGVDRLEPFCKAIAERIPDPSFVAQLTAEAAASPMPEPELIRALYACGGKEEAVAAAIKALRCDASDLKNATVVAQEVERRTEYLLFLADAGAPVPQSLLRPLATNKGVRKFRKGLEKGSFTLTAALRQAAIVALARTAGQDAQPFLEKVYEDSAGATRLVAAWALQALGAPTGADEVRAYAERRTDIEWLFVSPASIRSTSTDDALVEHFRRGVSFDDRYVFMVTGFGPFDSSMFLTLHRMPASPSRIFLEEQKTVLVPLFIGYMNASNPETRAPASRVLMMLTGLDVGYDPSGSATGRQDAIKRFNDAQAAPGTK